MVKCPISGTSLGEIFESIWVEKNNEADSNKVICDVCQDPDDSEGDELVMCDGCNVAVHQKCYGSELLGIDVSQLESWLC